jgi:hypothetical protein
MDLISFKTQTNRASQAVVIKPGDIYKRALLKNLYNESLLSGSEITLKAVELDDADDALVNSMTFGLADACKKANVSYDSFWTNLIPAGKVLMCIIVENTSENAAQLSLGTTPNAVDIAESIPIAAKDGERNKLTTIVVNKPFDLLLPSTVFLHHAGEGDVWNDTILNLTFLFQ